MKHLSRISCLVNPIFAKEAPLIQLFVCTVAVHFLNITNRMYGIFTARLHPGSFVCPGSEIGWVTGVDDSGIGNDANAYFLTGVSKPRNLKPQTNP